MGRLALSIFPDIHSNLCDNPTACLEVSSDRPGGGGIICDRWFGMPLAGLTDDQLNWLPPGSANKVGAVLIHAIAGEDLFIQQHLQGQPLLWDSQRWGETIGIPYPPSGPRGWDEARQATFRLADILPYQQAVFTALTPATLDGRLPFYGYEFLRAQLLAMSLLHMAEQAVEFSAIKGLQP